MISNNKTIHIVALLAGVAMVFAMVGLHAQESANFAKPLKVDYKNSEINFSQYDSLLINDLDVSNTKIVPPPWKEDQPFKWEVSEKNVTALQSAFRESMHDQISANDGYPIVTESGPGVMEISVRIVSFMPYADRKEKVTTRGSGEMRIHVEVRDAQSEELIAIHEGAQEVGQDYGPNSDFARQGNLKALFDFWGQRIRIAMDKERN
jgi:hypothetical protein